MKSGHRAPARILRWTLFACALGLGSLFVGWRVLAAFDFGYPVLYDVLDIDATIARYAPDNEERPGFERTDRTERERLFAAIARAVRHRGKGLEALTYHAPNGSLIGPLLTDAEIQHLRDVATLVTRFERLGWLSLFVLAALTLAAALRGERMPATRYFAAGAAGLAALAGVVLLLAGPVSVFYWLHEQIFPPGHQWFFWYRESLMSTMMQAPNLFGGIAVLWLLVALPLAAGLFWGARRLLEWRAAAQDAPDGRAA